MDEDVLEDMIELETQVAVRDGDIKILIATLIDCIKKYKIDKEFINKKM